MRSVVRGIRAAAFLLALLAPMTANAQDLQTGKPIRLIVGLSAGGGTDVTARLIAQQMTQNMGTTVLVENKAGGNFIPAGKEVLSSPPDRLVGCFPPFSFTHRTDRCGETFVSSEWA